jgi:Mg/Co/Ni transporter MgtE
MENVEFGIELELSTSSSVTTSDVVNAISENATVSVVNMSGVPLSVAKARTDVWKVVDTDH